MKKKEMSLFQKITLLVSLLCLLFWGVCMYYITNAQAQSYRQFLVGAGSTYADQVVDSLTGREDAEIRFEEISLDDQQKSGFLDYRMLKAISEKNITNLNTYPVLDENARLDNRQDILDSIDIPVETAIIIYDTWENMIHQSSDYVYFSYKEEADWGKTSESGDVLGGYGWIKLTDELDFFTNLSDVPVYQMEGYFEDARFTPVSVSYVTEDMISDAKEKVSLENMSKEELEIYRDSQPVSALISLGLLNWNHVYQTSISVDAELVTIYTSNLEVNVYELEDTIIYEEEPYKVDQWLRLRRFYATTGGRHVPEMSTHDSQDGLVVCDWRVFEDLSGETKEYVVATAMLGHPWQAAVKQLIWVYIVTFLLGIVIVWGCKEIIRKILMEPLAQLGDFERMKEQVAEYKDENTRLNTALDYAKDAEQNRRQMVSNIAHELKTPLAVIHSYAEGLQANIAENKRDKYLNIILNESERMDEMVLEMLDLSRLEAGRVKLSRSEFSLSEMTKNIFENLEMAVQVKGLEVQFDFSGECIVNADEARIGQVIENFVTNAVKYTPMNGRISVKIHAESFGTTFAIANDSEPFAQEALSKVWETFYRVDESRSSTGTGLGLSIAKNIVELHGGKCGVRNTENGVEFNFTI